MNDRALNIKMPSELYEKLQEEAKRKNISLASLRSEERRVGKECS